MALTALGKNSRQEHGIDEFLYLAVGTGTATGNDEDQTDMTTELERVAITASEVVGATVNFSAVLDTSVEGTIKEAGIFDAAADGNLLSYKTVSPSISKTTGRARIIRMSQTLDNAA